MWRTLDISESDWRQTPAAVQTKLRSQYHETHSLKLRSVFAQKQIASLTEPAVRIRQLNQRIASQQKQITQLQQQLTETARQSIEIARLNSEIAVLKEKLGQNSRNSNLPPSADSPFKPAVRREPSGYGQGAQVGHSGVGRNLKPIEQVDAVVDLRPTACSSCGSLLLGADNSPARRQVVEITAAGTLLTEYRRHALRCLACRKLNRGEWSEKAENGAFGGRVIAVIGYLTGRLGISHRDAAEIMQELFKDAGVIIGGNENGIVTSDRYPGYNHLEAHRQICWAHLKRDFQAIAERDGDSKTIGEGLLAQSKQLFRLWQQVRDGMLQNILKK